MSMRTPFYEFGKSIAEVVFSPHYYEGPWYVQFELGGRVWRRVCKSYASAHMWANYIQRRYGGGSWSRINLSMGKVLP